MLSRILKVISLFVACGACVVAFSASAFAEGDTVCSGKIMGTTNVSNPNAGRIYFDSHSSPNPDANKVVDLSIKGVAELGLAPGDRKYAACVSEDDDSFPRGTDEYIMRGYAWDDNLGFISFYCNGESGDGKNEGVDCGDYDYAVNIGSDKGGFRQLSGYAWNEAFGYIDFGPHAVGGEVTMNVATGALSGYAWSEAEVWIDFGGVTIQLPGEEVAEAGAGEEWCDGKPWVCVQIDTGELKLANGDDEYEINLYLRGPDGVSPLDLDQYDLNRITFNWQDTVKRNQLAGSEVGESLNNVINPWAGGVGAVAYKPINADLADFDEIKEDPGHYILKQGLRSYAPTTNANISYTTSIQPAVAFYNEAFFTDLVDDGGTIWSHDVEPNVLKLKNVAFELIRKNDGQPAVTPQVIYPNGVDGLNFKFQPAVEVNSLYANDLQDTILSFRGIPVNFRVGTKTNGNLTFSKVSVDLNLDYAKLDTEVECADEGADSPEVVNFDFSFVDNGESTLDLISTYGLGTEVDVQAVATLPEYDEESEALPCSMAQGPTLYSVVNYVADGDGASRLVSYYSNKLPRVTSSIVNPVAVIHGNIYAPEAFSPTSEGSQTQATGNVAIDIVRNTVNENVKKYLADKLVKGGGICEVAGLLETGIKVSCNPGDSGFFATDVINGEHVLYFKGSEVHLSLAPGKWEGKWVVIVDGGRLYIDSDVYRTGNQDGLAIVQMRPYAATCAQSNIYINSNVKNIQANMVSDCSLFSYDDEVGVAASGFPAWGDFASMVNALGNQLLLEGSIASRNTVGGADLDVAESGPKDYLLLGTGEVLPLPVTSEERQIAQMYDLNYLRLFRLDIEKSEAGLPIDQSCGSALTIDDMITINEGVDQVIGENGQACDGIDPTNRWNPPYETGDLVSVGSEGKLAAGLDPDEDFDPLYIFYKTPDSFVFEKAGASRSQ
ncbi:MAG: hypothetical protein ABIH78_02025 [Candidatus Peregrinibacteria bacterium]